MAKLHDHLLEQAEQLSIGKFTPEKSKKPRQADLRRSLSTCYYALFHLLIDAATKRAFPGDDDRSLLRNYLARTITHKHMKNVALQFSRDSISRELHPLLNTDAIDEKLFSVAKTFVILHALRNDADYDLNKKFIKREVLARINDTKEGDFVDECPFNRITSQSTANTLAAYPPSQLPC